jgi:hypothetical protein
VSAPESEDPEYAHKGGFPDYELIDPPVGFARFVSAMRRLTPIDTPLRVVGRVDSVDGRKAFVSAELTNDGVLLAEATGLMVRLLPGQP